MRHRTAITAFLSLTACAVDPADHAPATASVGSTIASSVGDSDDGDTTDTNDDPTTGPVAESTGTDDGAAVDFDPAFALAQVDAALAAGVPGLAIAIVYDGEIVLAEGFGVADENGTPVDATTLFNMASVTKVVTALTVLSARNDGLVTLDTAVPTVVPEFVLRDGFDPNTVQIRHLLTHSSGLGDWPTEPYVYGDTLIEEFAANPNQPLWFAPGAVFDYSNRGFTLAGLVAARLHGGTFAEATQARVLAPFGMDGATLDAAVALERTHARGHTTWDGSWLGPADYVGEWYQPSGGMWAGAVDLGHFVQAFADPSSSGFDPDTILEAQTPAQPTFDGGGGYGYGLFVDSGDPTIVFHDGSTGGYLADLEVIPSLGFGVAVVVNTDAWSPSQAGWAIVDHYAGPIAYPDPPELVDPASFPGAYDDPWQLGHIEIVQDDQGLQASFTDLGQSVPLIPLWGSSFECTHPVDGSDMSLMFWPDADGSAAYLVSRAGVAARSP